MSNTNKNLWEEGSFGGVRNEELSLVRTSPHVNRWKGNEDGSLTITAREDSDTYSRSTTHFTLNSTVQDHSSGSFSTGRFAVISGLREAGESNTITGLSQVDTWMLPNKQGEMILPNATVFAPEGEEIPNIKGVNIKRYQGSTDVKENYKALTESIESYFKEDKKPVFSVTPHGWLNAPQPTLKEREVLGSLLGSSKLLDAVHSGSKDELFENSLSDGKKLIGYLKEDAFDVNELPPSQQVANIRRSLEDLLKEVDGDVKDLYQKKIDDLMPSLTGELDKWIDKHYPPEPVNKPSDLIPSNHMPPGMPPVPGMQTELVPSSTIPPGMPPIPSSPVPMVPSSEKPPGMPPIPGSVEPPFEKVIKDIPDKTVQTTSLKDPEKNHNTSLSSKEASSVDQSNSIVNKDISLDTARASVEDPLSGLSNRSFSEQLKGMGIYVVDVETTGLEKTDKMFSSGRVKIDEKGNIVDPSQAIESHYDIGTADKLDKKLFQSEDSYIEAVEKNLARAHSSKKFGQEQKERGSLRGNAEARSKGTLTTPASFLGGINEDLDKNTGGSIIWGHNNAFEDRQFSTDKLGGDPEYVKQHDDLLNRNVSQTRSIFGSNKGLSNRAEDINERGLTQKASNILYNDINESILSQDPDKLRQALGKYAATNVDIINNIQEDIETVRYQKGKYVSGDSLNLSRALMSFGAVTDQVDPRNLLLGNKIETLAEVLLDGYKETHQALDDAKVQGKITSILTEEIDQFRKDPNYKSEVAAKLDSHITANRGKLANASYKQSVIRQIKDVEDLKDSKGFNEVFSWLDQTTKNYSVIPEGSSHRSAFTRDFRTALDAAYKEKDASIDKVKARMESFIEDYKLEDTAHRIAEPDSSTKAKSLMKKALEGKNKFITIGAGLAAANLVIGGGEKGEDKKYNTYDELYNNQYYGSGFADWQERNNSHKVLY